MDGIIILGDGEVKKQLMREKLAIEFELKDFGRLKYFLGIEVVYSNKVSSSYRGNMFLISLKRLRNFVARLLECPLSKIIE